MSQTFLRSLSCMVVSAALFACDDGSDSPYVRYVPRTVDDGLLYAPTDTADTGDERQLVLVDVTTNDADTKRFKLPPGTVTAVQRPGTDGREVVVMTSGLSAVIEGKDKRPASFANVLVFSKAGEQARIPLSSRYRSLAVSPNGQYAIAFGSTASFSVENSAEVVDLVARTTRFVDLSRDARAPSSFVFAPDGTFPHKIAVAPQPNALQIIDLEHPDRGPISITLSSAFSLTPEQIVFSGDRIFVRSANSETLVVLQNIDVPKGSHPWQLAPQVFQASGDVRDIAVTGTGANQRLLALTGSFEVYDPSIGLTATVGGVGGFARIHMFRGRSPFDELETSRALLYSDARGRVGAGSAQIGFVDLGDEKAWSTRNIETVDLGDAINTLHALTTQPVVVASHNAARASVIDLQARQVRRVVLQSLDSTLLLDERGANPQLWARSSSGEQLGRIDLKTSASFEVPMTFSPVENNYDYGPLFGEGIFIGSLEGGSILRVPSATRPRIAVLERANTGKVTFLDANATDGASAAASSLEVLGMFLSDHLD